MNISNLFRLLIGISLFLFGMSLMGDGLKRVAGSKLEHLLAKLTDTPLKGILLGTGVTAVIQSSSATSVMTVGFVNAGMMKFRQSIGIILGSILGTSITGWIIAMSEIQGVGNWAALFSTTTITGLFAIVGILFHSFSKRYSNIGNILLGFAVLMVGIEMMSDAVEPLSESAAFISLLTMFSNPILGIIAGTIFTAVLQSASAAVGILQTLTATGAIDFASSLPILLGISIGAAVPVLLSALAATTEGKRTSFVYLLTSVIGVIVFAAVFYLIDAFMHFAFMNMTMNAFSIALVNTLFRLVNVIVLCPFINALEKLTCLLVREHEKSEHHEQKQIQLEERFLPYPSLAISQSRNAICDMAQTTIECVQSCFSSLEAYSKEGFEKTAQLEQLVDCYENDIGTYLMKLSRRELAQQQNADVFKYLHTLSYFERITDHAMGIAYIARNNQEENIVYSDKAESQLHIIIEAVSEMLSMSISTFIDDNNENGSRIASLNAVIHGLCSKAEM